MKDAKAILKVQDRGIGIPAEDLSRIFGRFERTSISRNYGGLGLGGFFKPEFIQSPLDSFPHVKTKFADGVRCLLGETVRDVLHNVTQPASCQIQFELATRQLRNVQQTVDQMADPFGLFLAAAHGCLPGRYHPSRRAVPAIPAAEQEC